MAYWEAFQMVTRSLIDYPSVGWMVCKKKKNGKRDNQGILDMNHIALPVCLFMFLGGLIPRYRHCNPEAEPSQELCRR